MLHGVPGILEVRGDHIESMVTLHRFRFTIPREYPHDLDLEIHSVTALYHPRIASESGKACYQVHGEIDRVLIDLVFNVLLRPDLVRPPCLYPEADWGLDRRKMEWYCEAGPERIHARLLAAWRQGVEGVDAAASETPARAIRFLE